MSETVVSPLVPSLVHDDARAAITWLCEAFGFDERLVVPGSGSDGR